MPERRLCAGDVVYGTFPEHVPTGREQRGFRPAIVAALPDDLCEPRFPVVLLVPLTTDRNPRWATQCPNLYIRLAAGAGGLPSPSIALLDQIRALDAARLHGCLGSLSQQEYKPIRLGLLRLFNGA